MRTTGGPARSTLVAVALAVALVPAAACADDGPTPEAGPASSLIPGATFPPTTPATEPLPPRTLAEVPNPVTIAGRAFEPATIEVTVGDAVTWNNRSDEDHWVLADDPEVADSAPLKPGNSYTATFDEPGTVAYVCNVHPTMRGTVVVRSADDGR